ncbi:phosphatase PAP2 family protein [[Clostridium] innocuum]|uniref:phosphatase PAP2 family protein n=1 Tax=Clostridium innocuum TaxID=1522 RepID=UPI001F06A73F|nr:phosphatase PAP2 family protein [[Clostridium] innocuum]MCH1947565.1 phosphatase PAP2 family protein [[Clostridium] innocuum]
MWKNQQLFLPKWAYGSNFGDSMFLQWKHNPYERVSLLRYVLVAGGIALMAISRMMMGAHFLSDTIAGFLITYTLYLIWKYHFRKRGIL